VAFGFTSHLRRGGVDAKGLALLSGKVKLGFSVLRVLLTRRRNPNVHFYDISGLRKAHPDWFRDDLIALMHLLSQGRISPHIAGIFKPDRAAEAHRLIEAGTVTGRLVLDLRDNPKPSPTQPERT
jgi:NADPH2:quinone reductase